ncbi:ergot alkaloid biosynthesis protein [Brevibacillus laterosporus]|uniref:ergot alkaloid biosynthesis protein n=1 Tax=Brevibacillus laterosporus TaxID=1465 RepID=UPI002654CE0C|nr:ergot alkaloid biosynthesis protein [Brevibacillus laterosporus]MDN9011707.1 ergot alkaloid biosynthesis protein [Brevibacillus laterosporus]MDO0942707.1 ergot alkaloid biosynthesis protein [Brevibacillus laterosporus]
MEKKDKILITGGTGTTGSRIAKKLTELGHNVRIASRAKSQIAGTERVHFDWHDGATYERSLENVKKLYLVAPAGVFDPAPIVLPFLDMALKAGVQRIVMLSALIIPDDGPVFGKLHEAVIKQAPEWAVLKPSYFMQNFINLQHGLTIKNESRIITATGNGKIGFIDAEDIAEVGVRALIDEIPHNTSHVITGPQALSYSEVAAMIGSVIGRTIKHVNIHKSTLQEKLAKAGLSMDYARFMADLDENIGNGAEKLVTDTVERVTGRKPRSMSDFISAHTRYWIQE